MQTLDQIGLKYGTDKASSGHNYLQFYERFLAPLRDKQITLVEAGIGGYEYPDRGGESLRMWREYFPSPYTYIVGFDVYDKSKIDIQGVHILQISQDDETRLTKQFTTPSPEHMIDVFIDDASHINPLSIRTFEIMFPLLKPGGIYIWEDIHTSYWRENYEGAMDRFPRNTAITFLHNLQTGMQVDTLADYARGPWDGHVQEMYFMRNSCVIIKRK